MMIPTMPKRPRDIDGLDDESKADLETEEGRVISKIPFNQGCRFR